MRLASTHHVDARLSRRSGLRIGGILPATTFLIAVATIGCSASPPPSPCEGYATPEEAMAAVCHAIESGDSVRAEAIFGPEGCQVVCSDDDLEDQEDAMLVKALADEQLVIEYVEPDCAIALLGPDEWPFSVPLVLVDGEWRFDSEAGEEELLNRQIGQNELRTIATLHELVDAQREYYLGARDGEPRSYAMKLMSDAGKRDGLCWVSSEDAPDDPNAPESPIGEYLACAHCDPCSVTVGEATPFHGYYYSILTAQGEHAPGGAKSYVDDNGALTAGFAAIAWPAEYDGSGVMTFVVNDRGIVYEKDLGPMTEKLVASVTTFDPDSTWMPSRD